VKTIVLLHGWGLGPPVFEGLAARLRERYSISAPALPGYRPSPACEPYTLATLAREVAATAPECCGVVGWSLGAHIALEWARTRPAQVERLALIGATPCFMRRADWDVALEASTLQGFADTLRDDPHDALERFTFLQAQGDRAAKRVMLALRATLSAHALPSRAALEHGLEILRDVDLRAALGDIAQRTLVVHGENDRLVPAGAARALVQRLPHARLELLNGVAHAPFVSDPPLVARLLAEHFDER
jgi:pimeloyl-[acyl-carrier protein] methyl ester esterase